VARPSLKAVLFDVDFTLARPGPELGAEGYARAGQRCGLALDAALYEEARDRARERLERHPELVHDEEIWVAFTERVVTGMGGDPAQAEASAVQILEAWERSENFDLYDDVLPALAGLRAHGLKLGLVSNGTRDLEAFVRHHGIEVDAAVSSRIHGKIKPDPSIFRAALERLQVAPEDAVMVGDQPEDDVEGARSIGMDALLLDREDRFPERADRIRSLGELPVRSASGNGVGAS
jgi:putative hydrolase of the HAD superfamily